MNASPKPSFKAPKESGIPVGRIGGAPVLVGYSWLILAALIFLVLLPRLWSNTPPFAAIIVCAGYVLVLFISVLVHELAHALEGNRRGHRSEKIVLTFMGGHTDLAAPTQGKPLNKDLLFIALVGPFSNLLLAFLTWLFMTSTRVSFFLPESGDFLARGIADQLLWAFFWSNLLLGIFNLLPGFPLDGGQIIESLVWKITGRRRRGTEVASWAGMVIACGLVALAVVLLLAHAPLLIALGTGATGLFLGRTAYQQLNRIPLLDFVDRWDIFTRMIVSEGRILEEDVPAGVFGVLAVCNSQGRVVGMLDAVSVSFASSGALAGEIMQPVQGSVERDESTSSVIEFLGREQVQLLAVIEQGVPVGFLSRQALEISEENLS